MATKKATPKKTSKIIKAANSAAVKKAVDEKVELLANGKPKPEGYEFGRPGHYHSKELLEKAINEYFDECPDFRYMKVRDGDNGEHLEKIPNPTVTGLAYALGFESRQSFYDYEKRGDFSYIIKRARLRIESQYETKLSEPSPSGAIFALKNMNWSDATQVQATNTNLNVEAQASKKPVTKMSEEDKAKLQQELEKMGFNTSNDFLGDKEVKEDE